MTVFLDMDGVLCDFVAAAGNAFAAKNFNPSEFDVCKQLGVSLSSFWKKIDQTPDFWINLKPYPWFHELVDFVEQRSDFFLLSAPSLDSSSYAGKREWVEKYFGRHFNRLILTKHKYLLADPNAVLIDDSEKNCQKFEDAGGRIILFPQPWNSNRGYVGERLKFVKSKLRLML